MEPADAAELEESGFTSLLLCAGSSAGAAGAGDASFFAGAGCALGGASVLKCHCSLAKCLSYRKEFGANGSGLVPGSVQSNISHSDLSAEVDAADAAGATDAAGGLASWKAEVGAAGSSGTSGVAGFTALLVGVGAAGLK